MFSFRNNQFFKKISFRLTFGFILFFSLSSIFGLLLNYYLFSRSIESRDHENLYAKAKEYSNIYTKENLENFKKYLMEQKNSDADSQFLIRITSPEKETIFIQKPEKMTELSNTELDKKLTSLDLSQRINNFTVKENSTDESEEENIYELVSVKMSDGGEMQVARNTDERDDLLERYVKTISFILIINLFVAAIGGFIFSHQALKPLRNLIEAIKRVRSGQLYARIPVKHVNDEFAEISVLFNKMAERIETLILNMQETLDTVAHELKTPLTRLKSRSELALLSRSEETYKAALVTSIENTVQITSLIDTIMDISEAEVGLLKLNLIEINSEDILNGIIDLFSLLAEEKNIQIQFVQNTKFNFMADRTRFTQVISNLMDNAIKYSDENTFIKVETSEEAEFYKISISDQGLGISDEDLPKIWDRLFRTNPHHKEKGLGLGLSLVRSICSAHGWKIKVQSKINEGSIFTLKIKIHRNPK